MRKSGGRTWTEQKIYNGQLLGRDLIFTDSTHGWLLCDNGKVFHTSNNGGIISAISSEREQTPSCFLLMQNYPNPFNPTTIINYQIPSQGDIGTNNNYVTLKVYDVLGRLVKTLVDGYKTEGSYSVSFNASNLSSGVYFYQLKAGSYIQTKKLILLK